jgi:hypothetical protein
MNHEDIAGTCAMLGTIDTRGELGQSIADIVLLYSPRDLQRMRWNFASKVKGINPDTRKRLEETITGYLHGTYEALWRMDQGGSSPAWTTLSHIMHVRTGRWWLSSVLRAKRKRSGYDS